MTTQLQFIIIIIIIIIIQERSRDHRCSGRAINITYSECVFVVLVIQHAMCMRSVISSSVTCLAVPCFSTLPHKRHDIQKNLLNIKYVF